MMKSWRTKKGQVGLKEIPSAALYLGLAVVVVVVLIILLTGLETSVCTQNSGTEGIFNSTPTNRVAPVNPYYGSYTGCCSFINTSINASNVCETWVTAEALNATTSGISGLATFNDFWAVLVLIVILAVVIVSLYAVFPKTAGI